MLSGKYLFAIGKVTITLRAYEFAF